jgi:hypothetical protein
VSRLVTVPLAFIFGLLIAAAIIFAFGDKIILWVAGPYFIPNSLEYSSNSSLVDFKGENWTVSAQKDWDIQKITVGTNSFYFNQEEDDYFLFFVQALETDQSIKEQIESFEDVPDLFNQNPSLLGGMPKINVLESKLLKINDSEAGVVFIDFDMRDLIGASVLVNKDGKIYYLMIVTTKDFYSKNRIDVRNFIASFR